MVNQSKINKVKDTSITLKDYYYSLPEASCPKTKFIKEIARRCDVSISTVRYWILEGRTPSDSKHLKVLEDLTGIPSQVLMNNGKESK